MRDDRERLEELLQDALLREGRARGAVDLLLALAEQGPYFAIDPGALRLEDLYEL